MRINITFISDIATGLNVQFIFMCSIPELLNTVLRLPEYQLNSYCHNFCNLKMYVSVFRSDL